MDFPEDLKYSREHEWVRIQGDIAIVGITAYAQEQLGEIVYVELPDENQEFDKGDALGVVESVKSVSDIFSPVSGKVIETNDPVVDSPEAINDDPYGDGWLAKIKIDKPDEIEELLNAKAYKKFVADEHTES